MRQKGFTLIELLVVVAVIAILAAIALPNYREYTHKGRRAEAVEAIGRVQLQLERWRAENPSYDSTVVISGTYPTIVGTTYYMLKPTNLSATTYTLTASPQSDQAGDRCGNLVVTQNTKPDWSGDSDC